ncbi:MAG TPA: SAM-dependent methyltransferase [Pseudomonadota bacterium]|nr:SAM-dependent methyltransferase [Pseudomonadota bacterium]
MSIVLEPIGVVAGGREVPVDDDWGKSRARLVLDARRFTPDALAGLSDFSHLEVVYYFDRVGEDEIVTGARRPRGRADWPLAGIFAQRGKNRPNRLGVSVCKLIAVAGLAVEVEGLDAIAGTPILDIKPVLAGFLPRGELREPAWATELMKDYW